MKFKKQHIFLFQKFTISALIILLAVPVKVHCQKKDDARKLGMALEYFTSAKYRESLVLFQDLDKKYQLNPRYIAYIGVCYYYIWDYENAIKYLDEAIPQLDHFAPHERSVYYYCNAESHFNLQKYQESVPLYEKMLELCYDEEKADVLYHLGFCYMFQEDWLLARDYYRMALKYYKKYLNIPEKQARMAQIKNMIAGCIEHLPQEFNYLPICKSFVEEKLKAALNTEITKHLSITDTDSIKVSQID